MDLPFLIVLQLADRKFIIRKGSFSFHFIAVGFLEPRV